MNNIGNNTKPAQDATTFKATRRAFIAGVAASTVPLGATATAAVADVAPAVSENPALIEAYSAFKAAQAEVNEASDALEWLADEWKHLWPLAPEELLICPNMHWNFISRNPNSVVELDIVGRPLIRDTAALGKRFPASFIRNYPTTCFSLQTSAKAVKELEYFKNSAPRGRTEKALAKSQAAKARNIAITEKELDLSRQYEAETERLRASSGANAARERLSRAKSAVKSWAEAVAREPAETVEGLHMKADALHSSGLLALAADTGVFKALSLFVEETLTIVGRASA